MQLSQVSNYLSVRNVLVFQSLPFTRRCERFKTSLDHTSHWDNSKEKDMLAAWYWLLCTEYSAHTHNTTLTMKIPILESVPYGRISQ